MKSSLILGYGATGKDIEKYLISKFYLLYFYEILYLSFKNIIYLFLSYLFPWI